MLHTRVFHRASVGSDGRVYLWAGKQHGTLLEIYDPTTRTWREGPRAPSPRIRTKYLSTDFRLDRETGRQIPFKYERFHDGTSGLEVELPVAVGVPDGRIFYFGEVGVVIYEPARGEWRQGQIPIGSMELHRWLTPVAKFSRVSGVTAVGPDGKIYIAGGNGYLVEKEDRPKHQEDWYSLLDSLEVYDPVTETWAAGAPLLRARQQFAGVFGPDGKLYVFGGFGHFGHVRMEKGESEASYRSRSEEMTALGRKALNSVEAYDPATNRWEPRAPMPEGRNAMGAALGVDGKIYVIGGSVSHSKPAPTDTVQVYDPKTNTWAYGPRLLKGRFHHAVAAGRDGKIYVLGGFVRDFRRNVSTTSVEMLDTGNVPKPEGW
jgi:hypothetical protein